MSAARSFKKVFTRKRLQEIYTDRIKSSGAIGLDRMRPANLDKNLSAELDRIVQKVHRGEYRFTAYKEKLILKGASSPPRQISIPTARDRIVLRALCNCLSDVFPTAKLTLPQSVIDSLKTALDSGLYAEYAKIDLQKFYPSIPHELVAAATRKKIQKAEFRKLITDALTTPTVPESKGSKGADRPTVGVPQGLAISNVLAEIALQGIDTLFDSRVGIWYKRYVDDILILGAPGVARSTANELISELKTMGLNPHDFEIGSKSKVESLTDPFSFLGYQIEDGQVLIRHESILRFESSIAKIFTAYRHKLVTARHPADKERALAYCQWKLNLRITGCIFKGKRLGWAAYFCQITTTSQLRAINHTVRKLTNRFCPSGEIHPKSLIKTFYELQRGMKANNGYIPNLDALKVSQKREMLAMWLGDVALTLSDAEVERRFEIKASKAVRELEEDIAQTS
ncbi:reverse transcriptase domain-containing protein [Pseudomonas coleopterorum]|uniref:reverse transcriptase domain-containing protein n=1 Tax=Pseudomonas coleopterorum TaxID=1605838 RepID=UPI002A69C8A4|nr:reverse transcriptase domain-containing protein [Pseudomonas coleopterorum]MDY1046967.1 reverse transcriptase domain-containing protein [Pseudomonas coleopterorum]